MKRIFPNRLAAILLCAISFIMARAAYPETEGLSRVFYDDLPRVMSDTAIVLQEILTDPYMERVVIEARATNKGGGRWGVEVGQYSFSLKLDKPHGYELDGGATPTLSILKADSIVALFQGKPELWSESKRDGNTVVIDIDNTGLVEISGGHKKIEFLGQCRLPETPRGEIRVFANTKLTDCKVVVETQTDPSASLITEWDEKRLIERFGKSTDPLEGFYEYLDGDNDPKRAVAGGRYKLALVADGDGGYRVIYAGGASVASDRWRYGMLKAQLSPTNFVSHFDVRWIDSVFQPIVNDVSMSVEQGIILTFNFPRYNTVLRYTRCR